MGKRSREKRSRRAEPASPPPKPRVAPARGAERAARPAPDVIATPRRDPAAPPPSWAALWRERRLAIGVLFLLAVAVRIGLLLEIRATPFFEAANIDSIAYQEWATRIAHGAWRPTGTFYQSPFYAYFLALVYTIAGVGQWAPRIVQVLLGSVSPILVYAIGTRLFSRRIGWIAGIALALYGPIVLEEITLSKTTLLVVTALAGFALYLRAAPRGDPRGLAAAGVLFGVSVIGVGQWLLAFLALIAWTPLMAEHLPPARRRRAAAAFAAGGLVVVLPMVWWNSSHGGGLVLTSGDAGLNLYTGNNERASGLPAEPLGLRNTPQFEETDGRRLAEQAVGHPLSPAQVSSYWSGRALAWIGQHPTAWLTLLGEKLLTLWNGYEIPDNYHYPFMRAYFLPLLRPLITFGIVAPLALVGAFMPFWRRRDVTALYLVCFVYLATILLFYVRGRYRIPAVPFLIVFAAVAIERIVRAVQARRWPVVAGLAAGLTVAAVFTNHEYCEGQHHGMQAVCLGGDTWFDQEWLKMAEWYRNRGDLDQAIAYAERARECTRPRSAGQIVSWIAEIGTMQTEQLVKQGRRDDATSPFRRAEENYQAALRLGYRPAVTRSNLGSLYTIVGMPAEAVAAFEAIDSPAAMDAAARRRFARAYVAVGRCADAERVLTKLDRERGSTTPSDDTRAILSSCGDGR